MGWPALLRSAWHHALIRYVVIGAANTNFSYAIYAANLELGLSYPVASLVSLVAGICLSFKTQGHLVFRNMHNSLFGRFLLSWLLIYLGQVGIVALFARLGLDPLVGGALATPCIVVVGYLLQRHFVFGAASRAPDRTR